MSKESSHSKPKTYRRPSIGAIDKHQRYPATRRHHSPPPPHTVHDYRHHPEFWMHDFRKNVMAALFKEERFKAFQKRRSLDQIMDLDNDTDDEWIEQQRQRLHRILLANAPLYSGASNNPRHQAGAHLASPPSMYQQWLQQQQEMQQQLMEQNQYQELQQQHLQQQQAFINQLPTEIAHAVVTKNLPPEFYAYRETPPQV